MNQLITNPNYTFENPSRHGICQNQDHDQARVACPGLRRCSCLDVDIPFRMCGILFQLLEGDEQQDTDEILLSRVSCRGPDSLRTITRSATDHHLSFTSSVLHLRGTEVIAQPIVDQQDNVLSWNGEAWSGLDIAESANDTLALSHILEQYPASIPKIFEALRGPYAFVYYQVPSPGSP